MAERIAVHRARRPIDWRTLESPRSLAAIGDALGDASTVLVEDLTLLLNNLVLDEGSVAAAEARALAEVDTLPALTVHVVVVSNEVGLGVVPPTPLGREFRDALGRLNQHAAELLSEVYVLFAGLPLRLK
jgi:adenosylcobinamide kinase/adenosylcobinamide-phosphate guanylyltransferase